VFSPQSAVQARCPPKAIFKVRVVLAKSMVRLCQSLFLPTTHFRCLQNMSVDFVLDAEGGRVDARAAPQLYTVHEDQQQRHLIPLIKLPTLQVDFDREPENNSSVEED
jgi:hypothetical protein